MPRSFVGARTNYPTAHAHHKLLASRGLISNLSSASSLLSACPVRHRLVWIVAAGLTLGATVRPASAQRVTSLPDSNQTTTLTAIVSEQARVSVPANVTMLVNDVTVSTD